MPIRSSLRGLTFSHRLVVILPHVFQKEFLGILTIDLAKYGVRIFAVRSDGVVVFNWAVSRTRLIQ